MESYNVSNPQKLRQLVATKGLTFWKLAKTSRVHRRTIDNALKGEPIRDDTVSRLSAALGVISVDWLMPKDRVNLGRLPVPTEQELFIGRKADLNFLDNAWKTGGPIIQIVGDGGVGKSALVWHWLKRLGRSDYRGVTQALGWPFYSKGRREYSTDSRDFLGEAIRHFSPMGLSLKANQQKNAADVGRAIADLFIQIGGLVVLDGAEPLQHPPHIFEGRFRDPGLVSFLRCIRTSQPPSEKSRTLVIISTRWGIPEIEPKQTINLSPLSAEEGAELLRKCRLTSNPHRRLFFLPKPSVRDKKEARRKEFRDASREFGGHPLALVLLASFLLRRHAGNLRLRNLVPHVPEILQDDPHRHAKRIMSSYDIMMFPPDSTNPLLRSCREVLTVIGLFDRPVPNGIIRLLREPPILGITCALTDDSFADAIEELRDLHVLPHTEGANEDILDAHPLVREHFGRRLRQTNPEGWQEAHDRLYRYFADAAPPFPQTVEEMAPLYQAVLHGCEAGYYQKVFTEIYENRMGQEKWFSWKTLGLLSADLSVMAAFCEKLWQPVDDLKDADKAFVLVMAGFLLRSLGCVQEAISPLEQAKRVHESILRSMQKAANDADNPSAKQEATAAAAEAMKEAANDADNLSQCCLARGELSAALTWAKEAVRLADQTDSNPKHKVKVKVVTRSSLGHALHQMNRLREAEEAFNEAEERWKMEQDKQDVLSSKSGYRYCDFLITQNRHEEVLRRSEQTLKWATTSNVPLDIGLHSLSMGRVYLHQALGRSSGDFGLAMKFLKKSVDAFRQADMLDDLPLGLLARAELAREMHDWIGAKVYLDEAREIAESCGLQLHLVDCHLGYARLYLQRKNEKKRARKSRDMAMNLIKMTEYRRRDRDVQILEQLLQ